MTAGQQQRLAAAGEHQRSEPAATAAPQVTGRPVATVAAARATARTTATRQARPARAPRVGRTEPVAVPSAPAAAPTAAEPPPERPAERNPLDLPVLRIVCWQLAVVLALLGIGGPWPVAVACVLAAAALLAWTAVRVRGRWLSDELTLRARWLLRRRALELPEAAGGRVLLQVLAPGAVVRTVELAGTTAGAVSRREELLAILRPVGTGPAALAEVALSGALLADTREPGAAQPAIRLQLVLHRGPRQADQTRAWLAVRALRDPSFADDTELLAALNSTVRTLHRTLRRAGMGIAALTEPEVLATLVALTHTGPGRGTIREERRYWRAGPITQVGVRLTGLGARPLRARLHTLYQLLDAAPGAARTIAITVPEHTAVLRVAATTDAAADAAAERLLRIPARGMRLERMDNEHAPAVAASLPIGGNP
ncbi:hypothetical protein GCM10011581_38560 [Saccharopolyspora subtropica]|uniref:Type VII secretion protein EccE n=1 Tax=Saccharopolyspora thermophila TaxID=89367 RepID=A0A917K3M9_9PSEU|nr:hypothetical protein [Saccharopolyspora subtropica]GGI97712.1 hypothetical protein GCM10011581_38560 [Saccharopolyspora subtropica]